MDDDQRLQPYETPEGAWVLPSVASPATVKCLAYDGLHDDENGHSVRGVIDYRYWHCIMSQGRFYNDTSHPASDPLKAF